MALVTCIHKKFKCLKYLIYEPSLVYEGFIELLSLQMWVALLSLFLWFVWWKEKQLEKMSIKQKPRKNSIKTIIDIYNKTLDL